MVSGQGRFEKIFYVSCFYDALLMSLTLLDSFRLIFYGPSFTAACNERGVKVPRVNFKSLPSNEINLSKHY